MTMKKRPFENIVGKGDNSCYQHFLLFPQYFQLYQRQKSSILATLIMSSANPFNLVKDKIFLFGKHLTLKVLNPTNVASVDKDNPRVHRKCRLMLNLYSYQTYKSWEK